MRKKNCWISVTGIDGSGKTTLCTHLLNCFSSKAIFMKMPYFDWVREMIKISGDNTPYKDPYTDALIFATSNRLENYLIKEAMQNYDFVITQRCWLDNFPYRIAQGCTLMESINLLKPNTLEKPDIIVYLRCNYQIAYNRIKEQNGDKYETKEQMSIHEKEFENMMQSIQNNTFPIDFHNTKIITIETNNSIEYNIRELENRLRNII